MTRGRPSLTLPPWMFSDYAADLARRGWLRAARVEYTGAAWVAEVRARNAVEFALLEYALRGSGDMTTRMTTRMTSPHGSEPE